MKAVFLNAYALSMHMLLTPQPSLLLLLLLSLWFWSKIIWVLIILRRMELHC